MKTKPDPKRVRFYLWVALAHLCLWTSHDLTNFKEPFWQILSNNIWRTSFITVLNFIFFEYTLAFVLQKRKYIIYNIVIAIVALFIFCMIWSFGLYSWRSLGIQVYMYHPFNHFDSREHALEAQMEFSVASVFFFGIIRHIYNYVNLKQAEQQLRIEKQAAELNYLRSQTNPHFLFNTLNNIYSLTRDKSDLAPESVLRLSKLLRFMLYETGGQFIAIEKELKIISDYLALEQLRYDESLRVNFNYDIEDMKQSIPPLLLIPLVENAFKHGVSETRGQPFVDIHLSVKNRQLMFVVKNSTEDSAEPGREKIGLSNLRRQLELLYTNYDLSVRQDLSVFIATLKIDLGSHV